MHRVAFADEIFCLLPKIFSGLLKRFQFFRFQRPNHIEARLVLEFVKAHRAVPSGRHKSFSGLVRAGFSPCPTVYSFLPRFRADSSPEKMRDLLLPAARPPAFR